MEDKVRELLMELVSTTTLTRVTDLLNEFHKRVKAQELNVDMAKFFDGDVLRIVKFECSDFAIALAHVDDKYAVDFDVYNKKSKLVPIRQEHWQKLVDHALDIEKDYVTYNITHIGKTDEDPNAVSIPIATQDEEDLMLDTCMKVLDTIDGKEIHYKKLQQQSYGHVLVLHDDDQFVLALTSSGRAIFGGTSPEAPPFQYSEPVSEAMRTVFQTAYEKLPNTLPKAMQILLPMLNESVNSMSPEDQAKLFQKFKGR